MDKTNRKIYQAKIKGIKQIAIEESKFFLEQSARCIADSSNETTVTSKLDETAVASALSDFISKKKEERQVLNVLKRHLKQIDERECEEFFAKLFQLHLYMYDYYTCLLGLPTKSEIQAADLCDTQIKDLAEQYLTGKVKKYFK